MSVERKYDGEYCQIHINTLDKSRVIQIFSKSGKDSTQDRIGLQGVIKAGLKLGRPECKIKHRAILEGELLIYSRNERRILPFHHIRKHVKHGGRHIGIELDSPKKLGEHIMIVFFDILMLDEKFMINEPHRVRRAHLKGVVSPMDGEVQVAERAIIDFSSGKAKDVLRESFAHAIGSRWEGFVLKGLEDPYYSWKQEARGIKLKKDYIAGLGDSADLCIIGGHRDPKTEMDLGLGRLAWTTFYVACLTNKSDVKRFGARPSFVIIDRLGPGSMSKDDILSLNSEGRLVRHEFTYDSQHMTIKHLRKDLPLPNSIYTKPLVVEVFGAGFERPQSADFYVLRFPRRVGSRIKLHKDRDISDTVDFAELQDMAEASLKERSDATSQEEIEWVERLLAADPQSKYILTKSQSTSPSKTQHSATTASITPVGTPWATTQPSPALARAESEGLALAKDNGYGWDSGPQTPSRRSTVTLPNSTRRSDMSKRDSGHVEASPSLRASRKRKCVTFEPLNHLLDGGSVSDVTNVATIVGRVVQEQLRPGFRGKTKPEKKLVAGGVYGRPDVTLTNAVRDGDDPKQSSLTTSLNGGDATTTSMPSLRQFPPSINPPTSSSTAAGVKMPSRPPSNIILQNLTILEPIYLSSSLAVNQ